MTVSRGVKAEKRDTVGLPRGGEVVERKSVFGEYADSEMLFKLKALALNHCEPGVSRDSIGPLWNQTLRVREVMALSDTENFPRRKRKLQQFLKDKFKSAAALASEACNQRNVTKLSRRKRSQAASASYVLNMTDFAESLHDSILLNSHCSGSLLTSADNFRRQLSSEIPISDNAKDWGPANKNIFLLVDSDGSVNGSNPVTPEHMTLQESPLLDLDDGSNTSNLEESKHEYLHTPRRSIRLLNFIGDHIERMVIPIGPRFQADVPEWNGSPNEVYEIARDGDSDSSKYLGTKVWPIERKNIKTTVGAVGKGRSNSCSCVFPGSTNCINRHIREERLFLQSDLGSVFFSWKFDEMGEEVSKSWTLKEQESFELIAKTNLQSSGKNFLKHAMKCFPSKCRKDILSFYFNVFIPRRMNLQTRSLIKQVDGDVEAVEDVYNLNLPRSHKDRSSLDGSCKDVKSRYLFQS